MDRRLGVGLLLLIVGMILFYSILKLAVSEDNDFKDLMDLSPKELDALRECAPDEVRELEALNSAMTCTLRNERKHSITLLSSYPNGDSDHVRNIYEYTTSLTSFSEYGSIDAHHSLATSYQSGPWELYCRGSPDCNLPIPLWEVPFFVKSDYPTYAVICQHYGFDLPTHDKVIHIVRNPIDAIYGWYSRTNSDEFEFEIQYYVDQYREWQEYWRNYEFKYPYTPFIWFRFEDICYCPEHVLERLLDSTLAPYVNDDLIEAIKTYPCDLYTELGSGLSMYVLVVNVIHYFFC